MWAGVGSCDIIFSFAWGFHRLIGSSLGKRLLSFELARTNVNRSLHHYEDAHSQEIWILGQRHDVHW
jgi:hypothetical protein